MPLPRSLAAKLNHAGRGLASRLSCALLLMLALHPASAQPAPPLALVPAPRELQRLDQLPLPSTVGLGSSADAEDRFAAADLAEYLATLHRHPGATAPARASIVLLRSQTPLARRLLREHRLEFSQAMQEEGYLLLCEGTKMYDIAASATGIFYGVQTIKQLIHAEGSRVLLDRVLVRDWPAMRYRAQDDDLSRGPFPTLAYQKRQVRTLAAFKLNIYSPYFETSLQYSSEPLAAPPGGAMSPEDVRELVAYAARYHVLVLPQQEAFGHLHHLLLYDRYSALAELPHASVLAPGQPGALDLIQRWAQESSALFPAPFLHIGADETDDLGAGQTEAVVKQQGLGRVYLDFLTKIHETLTPLHKRLLFWGDVAMNSPELVKTLPRDMIAVPWHYSMPDHGEEHFDRWITPFTQAGIETWVAPSAARGNRIDADDENNLRTIQTFVADGQRLGATGMFNTVWNDGGEGLFEQDWYSVLFGAAASWQQGPADISRFEHSYGAVFHGDRTGDVDRAMIELRAAHRALARAGLSATNALFWQDPWSPAGRRTSALLLPVAKEMRLHAEESIVRFERARRSPGIRNADTLDALELGARKLDFLGLKFELAQEMLDQFDALSAQTADRTRHDAIVDASYDLSGNNGRCQDLRDGYGLIHGLYRAAWLRENRPYWLDNVSAQYLLAMHLWIDRGNRVRAAFDEFDRSGTLASREQLGMPSRENR